MFVAQALDLHGIKPHIISKKQKSVIYGAQYLHKPIPGLTSHASAIKIRTLRVGSPEVYAERVYGLGTMPTSWAKVQPVADAWDLRQTYDAAWDKFEADIMDIAVGPEDVPEYTAQFDMVISTIPLWAICAGGHNFQSQSILVKKEVNFEQVPVIGYNNWVIYNGTPKYHWYRASLINGHPSTEATPVPTQEQPSGWEAGFKVVGNDCDCHPTMVRAGRMGKWERGVLTHHAFEQTVHSITEQFGSLEVGSWTDQ